MSQKTHNFDFDCTSKAKATDLVGHPDFFCNFRVLTIEKIRGDLVRTLYPSGPAGWRTINTLEVIAIIHRPLFFETPCISNDSQFSLFDIVRATRMISPSPSGSWWVNVRTKSPRNFSIVRALKLQKKSGWPTRSVAFALEVQSKSKLSVFSDVW